MAGHTRQRRNGSDRGSTEDLVRQYLNELASYPLLSAAEEVALARAMEDGRAAQAALGAGDGLSPRQQVELADRVAAGADARRRFIQSNLRLVVSVAKRFSANHLSMLDLIQEGNLGLMRAVEKFDHRRGFKFSTYATWWIRQSITRAIADKSRTIRVPAHLGDVLAVLARSSSRLVKVLAREPTVAELAADTGLSVTRVIEAQQAVPDLVSLSAQLGEDDGELGDVLADAAAEVPFEVAAAALEREVLQSCLGRLNDREREVVELRFGLQGGIPHTLEDIGRRFELTRERIRQIEAKALTKLRHPSTPGHLRRMAAALG